MKILQNNFTTPEQSKKLLGLGIPADTADCFFYLYTNDSDNPHILYKKLSETQADYDSPFSSIKAVLYPCWSVGRLMEITKICITDKDALTEIFELLRDCTFITRNLCQVFEEYSDVLNFSKLED